MPKLKTRKAAAKRFKATGSGKFMRRRAFRNHLLDHKTPKQKRHLATKAVVQRRMNCASSGCFLTPDCSVTDLITPSNVMARVKRGNVARKRRNKILKLARGFRGSNGTLFRTANQRVMKALCNAYRDRRRRKRDFRRLWIARINAAARINGVSYSRLMGGLKKADVRLNRKMLAQLAVVDPGSFTNVVSAAKA